MATLLSCLEELYGTTNLYEVLNVSEKASTSDVKKAYYAVSLKVHPDRVEDDKETATKKFQALSQVYSILSDKDKRALYDESGEIDEESDILQQDKNWDSYWRLLFKKVTTKDIEEFESKYRFSEDERTDVLTAYEDCEGDMDLILENVPCCSVEDDERFKEIINKAISDGKALRYEIYGKENKRKMTSRRKKAVAESKEAEIAAKAIGLNEGEDELKAMIMKRNANRAKEMNSFYDELEAKYSKPSKKTKKEGKKKTTKK